MRYLILPITLVVLFALACGDGDGGPQPTSTSPQDEGTTPTTEVTPEVAAETLAFVRDGDVWLIAADGSGERALDLAGVQSFSWVSPDELDVVTNGDEPGHLLLDLQGGALELPFPAGGSWSSDGSLYVVPVDQEVAVFDRQGAEVALLTVEPPPFGEPPKEQKCGESDPLIFGRPVFSPDDARVLVAVECSLKMGATGNLGASIFEVSLDGSVNHALPVSVNLETPRGPRFSPDGSRIAQIDSWDGGLCDHPWWVTVADADGANSRELGVDDLEVLGGIVGYDWSPANDAVVASYDAQRCEDNEVEQIRAGLYLVPLDGAGEEELVAGAARSPAWSPFGELIAYVSGDFFGEETEPPAIRLFNLTTGQATDLVQGSQPAWQPQR